ncbi:hypothetical protein GALMADRAFT_213424 [Galerina marginata CBS 339.88]|uniref:PH domain-containing protein n=1 Tax=Galerina marginata (strain CBS 339.88) TaxID=685588 RepID=A0A067T0E4_GALM3|nr:hypothetical protein GALMADRAFT_213424 [Galerina marginata CBS 339.88]
MCVSASVFGFCGVPALLPNDSFSVTVFALGGLRRYRGTGASADDWIWTDWFRSGILIETGDYRDFPPLSGIRLTLTVSTLLSSTDIKTRLKTRSKKIDCIPPNRIPPRRQLKIRLRAVRRATCTVSSKDFPHHSRLPTRNVTFICLATTFPYDQWFLTHIDPTWKIRHLKQIILAKCLSLPFDPRKVAREAAGVRPPSPITFAPDESHRPASPIKFASVLEVRKKRSAGGGGGGGGGGQGLREDGIEGGAAGAGGGAGSSTGAGAGAGAVAVTATAATAASTSVHDAHAHVHAARAEEDGPATHEDAAPGEEGYEEDDEWDEEDDSDDHDLGGGSSSRPMGGRVGAGGFGGRVELPGPPVPPLGSLAIPAPQPQPASVKTARKFNPLSKLSAAAGAATSTSSNSNAIAASAGLAVATSAPHHLQQDDAPQIHTTAFTLVRFSTGQVLKEEFLVSWCDLVPHELVELYASSPIPGPATSSSSTNASLLVGFAGAVHLAKALMGPLPPPASHDHKEKKSGQQQQHQLRIPTQFTLTALPRHDLALYVQPYWEGSVRALRVVWRSEMPLPLPGAGAGAGAARGGVIAASAGGFGAGVGAGAQGPYGFSDYALGMTNLSSSMGGGTRMWVPDPQVPLFGGAGAGAGVGGYGGRDHDGSARDGYWYGRVKTKLEWREHWVVIRDEVINLCKTREDPTPTHRLPLSSLLSLRDASHLANSVRSKASYRSGPSSVSSRVRSKTSSHRPSERDRDHRRSTSAPRSSTSTAKDPRRQPREDEVGASTTPPVPGSSRTRGRTDVENDRYLRPPGLASTPASGSGLTEAERRAREAEREKQRERQREREKEREREREKERQRRRRREQEEKELEYLRRWDDIGILFGKKKDKEKNKGKGKGKEGERTRDKGKEKEKERGASSRHDKERERRDREKEKERKQGQSQGKPREEVDADEREREKEKQREKECERERERERERDRQRQRNSERERNKEKARQNERTYIPSSREEAEAPGMKIVCAKFKSTRPWERDELELKEKADREKVLKYTSTGPSLAGEPAPPVASEGDARILRSVGSEESGLSLHHTQPLNPPPRKASLPALFGLGRLGTAPSISMSSPATSSVAIHSGATAATASSSTMVSSSGPKFIGGLFGKSSGGGGASDKDGPVDKEERKREEKERKAREKEKETKALEKEREKEKKAQDKAKKKEETGDEEDYGVGSGLSWKLGKRRVGVRRDDRERVQKERGASLDVQPASAVASAPSGSTILQGMSPRQYHQHQEDLQSNFRSTSILTADTGSTFNDDDGTSSMHAQSFLINDDRPIAPSSIGRPKLTLSPIMDAAAADEQEPISAVTPHEALPLPPGLAPDEPQSDSNSSSLSLSSPVFAHNTDSGESGDEFDDEGRRLLQGGGKLRSRRAERGGYQYGAYQHHPRRMGREGGKGSMTDEKTESGKSRLTATAMKEEEGRVQGHGHELETRNKTDMEEVESESGRARGVYAQEHQHQHPPRQQQPSQHRRDERERERKRREDEPFNSILRIFHRYFSQPLRLTFVPSSITGLPTLSSMVTTHPQSQPESRSTSHSNLPTQPNSPTAAYPNSPIQTAFWSSTTLPVSSLASSSNTKITAATPGSDADDEDYGSSLANSSLHASRTQEVKPTHPSVLSLDTPRPKPIKNPSLSLSLSLPLAPALPYPEWRTEIVNRAWRHGMREAGRPLDLAQNGWRTEFEWVEEKRRERMVLRVDARQVGWGVGGVDEDEVVVEGVVGADADGEEEVAGKNWSASGLEEQRRMSQVSHVSTINAVRMNAAAGARSFNQPGEHTHSLPSTPLDVTEEWVDARESPSLDDHDGADADSAGGCAHDDYDPEPGYAYSYAYGHEDEEDALAQGMESLLEDGDSDEGERSETEWVAWLTDLPRQVEVRKHQALEAERRKEVEQENARAKKRVNVEKVDVTGEQSSSGGPQLSPMVFGNPFAEQQAQAQPEAQAEVQPRTSLSASLEPNVVIVEHTSTSTTPSRGAHQPTTQEERQFVIDSRRRFEPSARSYPQPPPALPPAASMLHSSSADMLPFGSRESLQLHRQHSHLMGIDSAAGRASIASTQPSSFSYTPAQVHVLSETRVRASSTGSSLPPRMRDRHRDRDVHRTPSRNTLSSPSSSDSLAVALPTRGAGARGGNEGFGAVVSPIDITLPSNSTRRGDHPISPVDSDFYGYGSGNQHTDAPSSSTTPPLATAHSNSHPRIVQTHRRTHSRSTSAAAASAVASLGPGGSGSGSVPSSPPCSPMPVGTSTPMHVPRSSLA